MQAINTEDVFTASTALKSELQSKPPLSCWAWQGFCVAAIIFTKRLPRKFRLRTDNCFLRMCMKVANSLAGRWRTDKYEWIWLTEEASPYPGDCHAHLLCHRYFTHLTAACPNATHFACSLRTSRWHWLFTHKITKVKLQSMFQELHTIDTFQSSLYAVLKKDWYWFLSQSWRKRSALYLAQK